MKNKLLLAVFSVLALALVCVIALYFLKPSPPVGITPAELLPEDTILAVELVDLERSIDEFKSSKLGKKLKETDLFGVLEAQGTEKTALENYAKMKSAFWASVDSLLFKELFGSRVWVAILPLPIEHPSDLNDVLPSVVLISQTKHRTGLVDFINRIVTKKPEYKTEKYKGHEITNFELENNITVYYSLDDNYLIATFDLKTLQKCLDLKTNKQPSLANNEYYQDLSKRLAAPPYRAFAFNNTEKMYENITLLLAHLSGSDKQHKEMKQIAASLDNWKGFNALGSAAYKDGSDMLQTKLLVMFDKKQMSAEYAKIFSFQPTENRTLSFMPEEPLVYYWTNLVDSKTLLNFYLKTSNLDEKTITAMKAKFKKQTGVEFDEALQAFGNQLSFVLTNVKTGGLFPVPEMSLVLQTKNRDTVLKLVNSLIRQSKMELLEEEINGTTINYLVFPFGNDLQPAYAFMEDFFIVSINRELIKNMIGVAENGKNIASGQAFALVNKGLTDKNNIISFVKIDRLIDRIIDIFEWRDRLKALKAEKQSHKSDIAKDKIVIPVLESLQMYVAFGSRCFINDSELTVNSFYKIEK
jgi:hypothetical protein